MGESDMRNVSWLPRLADVWSKLITSLIGAAALGLLAVLGVPPALVSWVNDQPFIIDVRKIVDELTDRPMAAGYYNILVADLANDKDSSQTEHVRHSLERQFDAESSNSQVRIQRLKRPLRAARSSDTAVELSNLQDAGRELLAGLNADVLIWGEVARSTSDKVVLRLRYLPRTGNAPNAPRSYALNEFYELSASFGNDLGALLAAIVASSITPAIEDPTVRGRYIVDVLTPLVDKLAPLAKQPPAAFTPDQVADLRWTYMSGSFALGRQNGKPQQLRTAVATAPMILQHWTRERAPEKWARTHNLLGAALTRLGHREHDTKLLIEAVSVYQAAMLEWTRAHHPHQWALTQNNLGNALWAIGLRDRGSTARLDEAVGAFRLSLEETHRTERPLDWALHHHNIGNVLTTLGDRTQSAATLREAVLAFETALLERPPERAAFDWSASKNGLGEALTALGELENRTQYLEQALAAFNDALENRSRSKATLAWGITRHGMARALAKLAELDAKPEMLQEARQAAEEALAALATDPGTHIEAQARATLEKIDAALKKTTLSQQQ